MPTKKAKPKKEQEVKKEGVEERNSNHKQKHGGAVLIAIISLIVIAGVVYVSQRQTARDVGKSMDSTREQLQQEVSKLEEKLNSFKESTEEKIDEVGSQSEKMAAILKLDSLDKYVELVMAPTSAKLYETEKPVGFSWLKAEGSNEEMNIAPENSTSDIFVLVQKDWGQGSVEEMITMYLQVQEMVPCKDTEAEASGQCQAEEKITYYGPFSVKRAILQ